MSELGWQTGVAGVANGTYLVICFDHFVNLLLQIQTAQFGNDCVSKLSQRKQPSRAVGLMDSHAI